MKRKYNSNLSPVRKNGISEHGWMTRNNKQPNKQIHSIASMPKISNIRYGAMKNVALPPENRMKQTTLAFSKLKKSVEVDFTPQECKDLSSNICQVVDGSKKNKKCSPSLEKSTSIKKTNIIIPKGLSPNSFSSKPLSFSSKVKKHDTSIDNTVLHSSENDSNIFESCDAVPTSCDGFDLYCNSSSKKGSSITVSHQDIVTDTFISLPTNAVHSQAETGIDSQRTVATTEGFDTTDYNLTMKFTDDSQGCRIFERFTQKLDKHGLGVDNLFTNSEKELYDDFENGLVNCEALFQSTEKL